MYSGEYDACDVTLSVYPHRASLKNMPGHGGNRTYYLWNTSPMLGGGGGRHWDLRYGGISLFFLRYFGIFLKICSITILEILWYTVFAILDSKTVVIDKICLWYYGIEYLPMPPSVLCQLSYAVRSVRVCDISEQNLVPWYQCNLVIMIFSVLVLCTQVNMMFVMLLWVYIHTGQAWKI